MCWGRGASALTLGDVDEVAQEAKTICLALLRMELGGVDVFAPDRRGEGDSVLGSGGDNGVVGWLRVEAVDEVEIGALGDALVEGAIRAGDLDLVPTDLGDLEFGFLRGRREPDHGTAEDAEAEGAGVEFLAPFEEGLVTDADSEERAAVLDPGVDGAVEFLSLEGVEAVVEGPDARKDNPGSVFESVRGLESADVGTDGNQCFFDAADVSGAVIEEREHVEG